MEMSPGILKNPFRLQGRQGFNVRDLMSGKGFLKK